MHFVHILLLIFKFKGKGRYIPLIYILSSLAVAFMYWGLGSLFGFHHDMHQRYEVRMLAGASCLIAGAVTPLVTKNVVHGAEQQSTEEEGSYMYIKVSWWSGIFGILAVAMMLSVIADMCGWKYFQ